MPGRASKITRRRIINVKKENDDDIQQHGPAGALDLTRESEFKKPGKVLVLVMNLMGPAWRNQCTVHTFHAPARSVLDNN